MNKKNLIFLILFIMLQGILPVLSEIRLTRENTQYRVTYNSGSEVLTPVNNYNSGDIIEFQISYRNDGNEQSKKVIIIGAIPKNGKYINESAYCTGTAKMLTSTDGGSTYSGEGRNNSDQYTHIRWDFNNGLSAGEKVTVKYRVRIGN